MSSPKRNRPRKQSLYCTVCNLPSFCKSLCQKHYRAQRAKLQQPSHQPRQQHSGTAGKGGEAMAIKKVDLATGGGSFTFVKESSREKSPCRTAKNTREILDCLLDNLERHGRVLMETCQTLRVVIKETREPSAMDSESSDESLSHASSSVPLERSPSF